MTAGNAWYCADRDSFLASDNETVVASLTNTAVSRGWHVEPEQREEWSSSVQILQGQKPDSRRTHLEIVKAALAANDLAEFTHVILEYDFRRRGLRIDCVLLGPGIVAVLEFKRTELVAADRDQVMNYCINLVEFHEHTRELSEKHDVVVVPILALTEGTLDSDGRGNAGFRSPPWPSILKSPLESDRHGLTNALRAALKLRRSRTPVQLSKWMESRFSPSSTMIDAAISLFGHHDVSAIDSHAVPAKMIDHCVAEVAEHIRDAQKTGRNRIVLISGAPGAGKTLVGLRLAFCPEFREDAVFVTGNTPLVDVLTQALKQSYSKQSGKRGMRVASGYAQEDIHHVIRNSTFKIVKAHKFLGERGKDTSSSDGRIVIFDQAQRTYEKGREVARKKLPDHEADLILASLEASYEPGATIVALLGHNQAINKGERGAIAWFEAARRCPVNQLVSY